MTATDIHSIPQTNTENRGILARIFDGLIALAEANPRLKKAEKLLAMSDAELEARGIRRDEIVQHVFRGQMYV